MMIIALGLTLLVVLATCILIDALLTGADVETPHPESAPTPKKISDADVEIFIEKMLSGETMTDAAKEIWGDWDEED
jgi:hypothetical protein